MKRASHANTAIAASTRFGGNFAGTVRDLSVRIASSCIIADRPEKKTQTTAAKHALTRKKTRATTETHSEAQARKPRQKRPLRIQRSRKNLLRKTEEITSLTVAD